MFSFGLKPAPSVAEDRREIAGRGVDDLQYLDGGGLLSERLVALGSALGKPTLEFGYEPLGSTNVVSDIVLIGGPRRKPTFRPDHTVIEA